MKALVYLKHLRSALPLAATALVALAPSTHASQHVWSGLGANNNFSNPQNWSAGGVPEGREANVVLTFPAAPSKKTPVQDIAGLGIDQMIILGDGYVFAAAAGANYFLRGGVEKDIDNGSNNDSIFNASAGLVLNAGTMIYGSNGSVLIEGAMTGTGGMTINGPTVEYAGNTVNTYSGLTSVKNGTLRLNKTIGVGFAGDLEIGITLGADDNERVVLLRANQIPDGADVTITPTGWLNLNGYSDTVHDITMTDGRVTTGAGTLSLLGQIHVLDAGDSSTFQGHLNLGVATRTITVEDNALLDVLGTIGGAAGAGIYKHGTGALWLSESNSFSGPLRIYEGHVGIFDGWALGTAAGRTYVHAGAELVTYGSSVMTGEGLNLNGDGGPIGPGAFKVEGFSSPSWKGDIVLESDASIMVPAERTLVIEGPISGPGGLTKIGGGILILDGATPNTFAGETRARSGALYLMKPDFVTAIPGALIVGEDLYNAPTNLVRQLSNHQIADNAPITVERTGVLNFDGSQEKIGPLTMNGGVVLGGNGLLTLDSSVTSYSGAIYGNIRLLGPTTFHLPVSAAGNDLFIGGPLQGGLNADLIKTGAGTLDLGATNTYLGKTIINEGVITARRAGALGGTENGTFVNEGGLLMLAFGPQIGSEELRLKSHGVSTNSLWFRNFYPQSAQSSLMAWADDWYDAPKHDHRWAGPIVLEVSAGIAVAETNDVLTLSGPISGPAGFSKVGLGTLVLAGNGANTYQGLTEVAEGKLHLNKTAGINAIPGNMVIGDGVGVLNADRVFLLAGNQIADAASVNVITAGSLDLNNFSETIGSLSGNGRVYCQLGTLTLGGNNQSTEWSGGIQGSAVTTVIKNGTGTWRVNSDNYYTGRTLVQAGAVDVRGSLVSTVRILSTASLVGTGTVGDVETFAGGTLSPGASVGMLKGADLSLVAGAKLKAEINGTGVGGYDQMIVVGTVNLGGATLELDASNPTPVGSRFVIVGNDGNDAVTGTFNGMAQGSSFIVDGQRFTISYTGGDGNDVLLTRANTPPSLSQITATAVVDEGGLVHINGSINDPDASDDFTFTVNWGDGSPEQVVQLPVGTQLFHVEHVYADDKPNAQPSDSFTINYTLTDSSGSPAFGQLNTIIGNVAPMVYAGGSVGIAAGTALTSTLTFADPGADTWTATVDYGDGTGPQALVVGAGKSLPISHTFPANGTYTVTVEVTDDDGGKGTGTITVLVGMTLAIAPRNATAVDASWPAVFTGCVLQSASDLNGTNWVNVPGSPVSSQGRWVQTLPATNSSAFFRLVRP